MHSTWFKSTFLRVLKFLQIKEREPNFWRQPILQKVWIIWFRLLYFNIKTFKDPNSLLFINLQWVLCDSEDLLSGFWNVYKLKRRDLISGGNQFCRLSELFRPPFCISISKLLWTQILCDSLDFNTLCNIQKNIRQTFEISTNKRMGT